MTLYFPIAVFLFMGVLLGSLRYKTDDCKTYQLYKPKEGFVTAERLYFIFFLLLFAFLAAMRSADVGNDTKPYINFFNYICRYGVDNDFYFEKGFQLFCLCVSKISSDPHYFLMISSIFCYGLLGIYSVLYSSNLYITICLIFCFCFSPMVNILRQDIAMVICLFAYQAFKRNNVVVFSTLVLLAMQFHTTALCMFSLLIIKFMPLRFSRVMILSTIFILVSCLTNMSGMFANLFSMYDSYFEGDRVGSGWLGTSVGLFKAVFMYYIVSNNISVDSKMDRVMYSSFWALIIFSALGFQMNLFNRCGLYFLFITVAELPNAIILVKGNKNFYSILFFCAAMLVYFFLCLILRPEWNALVPYKMW